jgi:hypothetical protein
MVAYATPAAAAVLHAAVLCSTPAEQALMQQQAQFSSAQHVANSGGLRMQPAHPAGNAAAACMSTPGSYMLSSSMVMNAGMPVSSLQPYPYVQYVHMPGYSNEAMMVPAASPKLVMLQQQQCGGSMSTQSSMMSSSTNAEVAFYGGAATPAQVYAAAAAGGDALLAPATSHAYGVVCAVAASPTTGIVMMQQQQQQPAVMVAVPAAAGQSYMRQLNQPALMHMLSQAVAAVGEVAQQPAVAPWVVHG